MSEKILISSDSTTDLSPELRAQYGVELMQLGYDRRNALATVQRLEAAEEPIECVEIRQHSSVLSPTVKLFKDFPIFRF